MRVISGFLKSRRFQAPKGLPTRPTTDKAKESLFNILNQKIDFDEIEVLDLFAGIGGISLEFISRGVIHLTSVEINHRCIRYLNEQKKEHDLSNWKIYNGDAFKVIAKYKEEFDVIFADPPYNAKRLADIPELIFESDLLKPGGILIVEHSSDTSLSHVRNFQEQRTYSKVNFSIFQTES
jgi:16S rRNA (guanine966-N2)-methyltransferase